jgi:hypothetical protein
MEDLIAKSLMTCAITMLTCAGVIHVFGDKSDPEPPRWIKVITVLIMLPSMAVAIVLIALTVALILI